MVGIKRQALEAVVRRVAAHPACEHLVLRGGMVSRLWLLPLERPVDDVDFLADPTIDRDKVREMLEALPALVVDDGACLRLHDAPETIWAETKHPGWRAQFEVTLGGAVETVQLDVGFGDPIDPPALWRTLPTLREPAPKLRMVRLETGLAWKLHGLFERQTRLWRSKDLHDLDLLLAQPCDPAMLRRSIPLAFSSRDTPLSAIDRLFEGELGKSRQSREQWEALRESRPGLPWSPLEETVARVSERLRPIVDACLPPLSQVSGKFPHIERLEDVWCVVGGLPRIVAHRRGGLTVINAENNDAWPEPGEARWPRTAHHRAVLRECRGLIFGPDGALIARPYHKIFRVGDRPQTLVGALAPRVANERPRVLEKLDGAMVTAGWLDGAARLFTRRGLSPLSAAAEAFLRADPRWLPRVEMLLDAGFTPIFEWCARAHRLVVDHPVPRLVLTGLRRRTSGVYLDYDALLAAADGLEVVKSRGRTDDLAALVEQVRAEPEGEGVVLRFDGGDMVKLKTDRYLRLHRAVESADPQRANWEVVLAGETALLLPLLSAEAAAELVQLEARIEAAITREQAWVEARLVGFAPLSSLPRAARGPAMNALVEGVSGPRLTVLRAAAAGEPVEPALRRVAREHASGAGARSLRAWLV